MKKRFKLVKFVLAALAAVTAPITGLAQERGQPRQRIDVQSYLIDAQIDPRAQTLNATALVRFIPQEETSALSFELNNALNLTKVVDEDGRQVPASRMQQDMTVRLSLPQPLQKGKVAALTFVYDGKLTGNEESPVFGIKFAAIHPDFSYLMYPARWFPVNDYTADRFSSDLKVTVPAGYIVVASGNDSTETAPAGMSTTLTSSLDARPWIQSRRSHGGPRRVTHHARAAGFGRVSVAIPGQVHDGRGAERRRGDGTRAARRSRLRAGRPRRWKGRDRQEPQEVAESVLISGPPSASRRASAPSPPRSALPCRMAPSSRARSVISTRSSRGRSTVR